MIPPRKYHPQTIPEHTTIEYKTLLNDEPCTTKKKKNLYATTLLH
jgi:hypothetical protein